MTPIPSEFEMDEHDHGHGESGQDFKTFYLALLAVLILSPLFVRSVRKLREVNQ
jgi:cytochrome c-type biogenesis protein